MGRLLARLALVAGIAWTAGVGGPALPARAQPRNPAPDAEVRDPGPGPDDLQSPAPWRRELFERRQERLQRFLDTLTPEERAEYETRIDELRRDAARFDELSVEERESLRARVRTLRLDLRSRRRLARQELLALPPEERIELLHKLQHFRELPEPEQRALRDRYRMLRERSPEERERLRHNLERWREMSPEQRRRVREEFRRLRALSPAERQELRRRLESDRRGPGEPPAGD